MKDDDHRPPYYLGIDLGGTNIKSGVVDDLGRPLSRVSIPTEAALGPDRGIKNLAQAGRSAVESSGIGWGEIEGVGLGSPGMMDIAAGLLLDPPNLPGWANLPIRQRLSSELGASVAFQNDANAAAYGEFWVGAGRGSRSMAMLTLGTGVGGGLIVDGGIIEGRHSHGAEFGHMVVEMDGGRLCSCGRVGHLEAYASATSLVKRAVEAIEAEPGSTLAGLHHAGKLDSRSINEAAEAGDALAIRLMSETARYLAVGATNIMHAIDPDLILFGGGMIAAGPRLLDEIRSEVLKLALPIPARQTRIEFAELGGDAGFIGAAGCARIEHRARLGIPKT